MKKFIIAIAALSPALSFAQEAVEHAAAHAEGGGPLEINWGLQIWVILTFVVMMGLLAKLAFKPIGEALERRGSTIKAQLDEAEKSRADAKKLMEDYQKQVAAARTEANKIIEEARAAAGKVTEVETQKAIATANDIIAKARLASEAELVRMKAELRKEVGRLVVSATVKVTGKVLTADDQQRLADETNRQLAA